MSPSIRLAVIPAVLAGWLLAAGPATARDIQDDAGLFGPDAVQKANREIREIKSRYNKDLVIDTVAGIPDSERARYERLGKNAFFQEWARERAKSLRVQGIYILICKEPTHLQVEDGNQTERRDFTRANRDRLVELLIAKFRQKQYDAGLLEGVEYVRDTLARNMGNTATAAPPSSHRANQGSSLMGWICFGVVILMGIWLVIGIVRAFSGGGGMGMGGGGGFFTGLLGGLFGAMAGAWLYNNFFGSGGSSAFGSGGDSSGGGTDTDYSGSGGDYGDSGGGGGGGDWGGGGGGDFGGGGGDF